MNLQQKLQNALVWLQQSREVPNWSIVATGAALLLLVLKAC